MTALREPLASYFTATNKRDPEALAELFTASATVNDEGIEYRGPVSIRGWIAETVERFQFSVEIVEATDQGDTSHVVGVVSGDFPGSPARVRYEFTVDQARIAQLKLTG